MLLYHDAWIHFHWTDDNIGSLRHTVKCSHEQRQSGMTSHNYTPSRTPMTQYRTVTVKGID